MDNIVRTISNTSTKKGNNTFKVTGHTWDYLNGIKVPVYFVVTDCRDDIDALGTAMDFLCGYLYDWTITV